MGFPPAGSPSGLNKLFDTTLGVAAASIDTGANAITASHADLIVMLMARTADAGATALVNFTVNGDTGTNYDREVMGLFTNATTGFGATVAGANWPFNVHGNGGGASYASPLVILIPSYSSTTFFKSAVALSGLIDQTATNTAVSGIAVGWRSTSAINQITATGATANLSAGSRLVIYGLQ